MEMNFDIVMAIMCRKCGHIFGSTINVDRETGVRTCPQCGERGHVRWD